MPAIAININCSMSIEIFADVPRPSFSVSQDLAVIISSIRNCRTRLKMDKQYPGGWKDSGNQCCEFGSIRKFLIAA